jgi:hypothetical protein
MAKMAVFVVLALAITVGALALAGLLGAGL